MAIYFSSRGLKVHAIDLLPENVASPEETQKSSWESSTKPKPKPATLHQCNVSRTSPSKKATTMTSRPSSGITASTVYTIETLAHAIDLPAVLGEFYRVLKPGGRVALYEYDYWMSSASGDEMGKVHRYGGIDPTATTTGVANAGQGLAAIVRDAGFENVHEEDLTANVRPLLRFLAVCLFVPYMIVRVLGLEARFIDTVAAVNYRRGWKYVAVTGRRP